MGTVVKTKYNLKKCVCVKCPMYSLACKIKAIPEGIAYMFKERYLRRETYRNDVLCF